MLPCNGFVDYRPLQLGDKHNLALGAAFTCVPEFASFNAFQLPGSGAASTTAELGPHLPACLNNDPTAGEPSGSMLGRQDFMRVDVQAPLVTASTLPCPTPSAEGHDPSHATQPQSSPTNNADAADPETDDMLAALALLGARNDHSTGGGMGFGGAKMVAADSNIGLGVLTPSQLDLPNIDGYLRADIRLHPPAAMLKRTSSFTSAPLPPCKGGEDADGSGGGAWNEQAPKRARQDAPPSNLGESDDLARTERVKSECRREAGKLSDILQKNVSSYSERQANELLESLLGLTRCGPAALLAAMAAAQRRASEHKAAKPHSKATSSGRVVLPAAGPHLDDCADTVAAVSSRRVSRRPSYLSSGQDDDGGGAPPLKGGAAKDARSFCDEDDDTENVPIMRQSVSCGLPPRPSSSAPSAAAGAAGPRPVPMLANTTACGGGGGEAGGSGGGDATAGSAGCNDDGRPKLVGAAKRKGGIKSRHAAAADSGTSGGTTCLSADEGAGVVVQQQLSSSLGGQQLGQQAQLQTSSGRVCRKPSVGGVFGEDTVPKRRIPRPPNKVSNVQTACNEILRLIGDRTVKEREIREILGNNPDTSKALRLLTTENKAIRNGIGGRVNPFCYVLTPVGAAALQLLKADGSPTGTAQPGDTSQHEAAACGADDDDDENVDEDALAVPPPATTLATVTADVIADPSQLESFIDAFNAGVPPELQIQRPAVVAPPQAAAAAGATAATGELAAATAAAAARHLPPRPVVRRAASLPLPMSALSRVPLLGGGGSSVGCGGQACDAPRPRVLLQQTSTGTAPNATRDCDELVGQSAESQLAMAPAAVGGNVSGDRGVVAASANAHHAVCATGRAPAGSDEQCAASAPVMGGLTSFQLEASAGTAPEGLCSAVPSKHVTDVGAAIPSTTAIGQVPGTQSNAAASVVSAAQSTGAPNHWGTPELGSMGGVGLFQQQYCAAAAPGIYPGAWSFAPGEGAIRGPLAHQMLMGSLPDFASLQNAAAFGGTGALGQQQQQLQQQMQQQLQQPQLLRGMEQAAGSFQPGSSAPPRGPASVSFAAYSKGPEAQPVIATGYGREQAAGALDAFAYDQEMSAMAAGWLMQQQQTQQQHHVPMQQQHVHLQQQPQQRQPVSTLGPASGVQPVGRQHHQDLSGVAAGWLMQQQQQQAVAGTVAPSTGGWGRVGMSMPAL